MPALFVSSDNDLRMVSGGGAPAELGRFAPRASRAKFAFRIGSPNFAGIVFYKDDRLALFIDGSNLYAAAKSLGFDIDYKLLRQEFERRGKLIRAYYYTALLENEDYSPIRPLVDWLHYNGYSMVTKPAREYTDGMGRRKVKGNMDVELVINAMELAPRLDHAVLFSGDGDFKPLVEALQRQGVRVSVVSTMRSQPPMIADELRRQADNFIELDALREIIGRPPREPAPVES